MEEHKKEAYTSLQMIRWHWILSDLMLRSSLHHATWFSEGFSFLKVLKYFQLKGKASRVSLNLSHPAVYMHTQQQNQPTTVGVFISASLFAGYVCTTSSCLLLPGFFHSPNELKLRVPKFALRWRESEKGDDSGIGVNEMAWHRVLLTRLRWSGLVS